MNAKGKEGKLIQDKISYHGDAKSHHEAHHETYVAQYDKQPVSCRAEGCQFYPIVSFSCQGGKEPL